MITCPKCGGKPYTSDSQYLTGCFLCLDTGLVTPEIHAAYTAHRRDLESRRNPARYGTRPVTAPAIHSMGS